MRNCFGTAAIALAALIPSALHAQFQLSDHPARLNAPIPPLKKPAMPGIEYGADEILVTFQVDSLGAVRYQEARIVGRRSHALMLNAVRQYLRGLQFVPASLNGRPTIDTVQVRFVIPQETLNDRPLQLIQCSHCDSALESLRQRVAEQSIFAMIQGADCARAFREIARTNPTDTLVWTATAVRLCPNGETAAALAVKLMNSGHNPDSTHSLRAQIAAAFPSRSVFDAAMAVASQGGPVAQVYALEILDRLQPAPRALGTLHTSPFRNRCGPYVVDNVRTPTELATEYSPFVRQLANNLLQDAKTTPVVRKAAQCLLDELTR